MKTNKTSFYKFFITIIFCLLVCPAFLAAQESEDARSTAEEIEVLLNTKAITYAQASRFVLEAANVLAVKDHQEAFNYAIENGWLPKNVLPDALARLDHISLLLMRSFDTSGGIMYTLTKNSRYAYRELIYLNVIQNRADPSMFVSGERLLFYVNRLIAREEMHEAENRNES